jgi:hypothetical protein
MHLWYLSVLFIFSLLMLPVFILLMSDFGSKVMNTFTGWVAFPGGIYVLAILIGILWKLIDPNGILGFDKFDWNLGVYLSWFLLGFIFISSQRLQGSIQNLRWVSLGLALVLTVMWFSGEQHDDLFSWAWILTFLGFGFRYLKMDNRFVRYANEAVLPFYILHQSVLLMVGYFTMGWAVADPIKWLVTAMLSLTIILVVYEYLVHRVNALRFLFGMKPLKKATQVAPASLPNIEGKLKSA